MALDARTAHLFAPIMRRVQTACCGCGPILVALCRVSMLACTAFKPATSKRVPNTIAGFHRQLRL